MNLNIIGKCRQIKAWIILRLMRFKCWANEQNRKIEFWIEKLLRNIQCKFGVIKYIFEFLLGALALAQLSIMLGVKPEGPVFETLCILFGIYKFAELHFDKKRILGK